jgi:hypothetical protein
MLPFLGHMIRQRPALTAILRRERTWFLLLWVLPALFFYIFIHMGQQGLVFVFLPVLLLLSAESALQLYPILRRGWRGYAPHLALSALIVGNSLIFLLAPEHLLSGKRLKILSWNTIRNRDSYYAARIPTVRQLFPPEDTVLLAHQWRHVSYYLPEYQIIPLTSAEGGEPIASSPVGAPRQMTLRFSDIAWPDPNREWAHIVLFDVALNRPDDDMGQARAVTIPGGERMYYLTWRRGQRLE